MIKNEIDDDVITSLFLHRLHDQGKEDERERERERENKTDYGQVDVACHPCVYILEVMCTTSTYARWMYV
jgi:hypothetical protein